MMFCNREEDPYWTGTVEQLSFLWNCCVLCCGNQMWHSGGSILLPASGWEKADALMISSGAKTAAAQPPFSQLQVPACAGSGLLEPADWQLRAVLMKSRFSFSRSTDWDSSFALPILSGTISVWWIFSGGKAVQPPSQRGRLCWDSPRMTGE